MNSKKMRLKKEGKTQLIAAVRVRRLLWDVMDREHKDQVSIKAAWESVGAEIGRDPHECKIGWRSLRQSYRYHCKSAFRRFNSHGDVIEGEPDPLETPDIQWEFADDMAFLQELSRKRNSDSFNFDEASVTNSPLVEDDTEYTDMEYLDIAYDQNNSVADVEDDVDDTIDGGVHFDSSCFQVSKLKVVYEKEHPKSIMQDVLCRTCAQPVDPCNSQNLFTPQNYILLRQIRAITELILKEDENLSDYICQNCLQNLEIATEFRRVCIEAQALNKVHMKEEVEQEDITTYSESPIQENPCLYDKTDLDIVEESLEDIVISDNENYYEEKVDIQPLPTAPSTSIRKKFKKEQKVNKFQCHECGLTFTSQQSLKMHMHQSHGMQLHTRYVCKHCGHDFKYSAPLVEHLKTIGVHFGYSCEKCGQKFLSRHFLNKHKKRVHGVADEHICHICGKNLSTGFNLRNHIVRHIGNRPHKCKQCNAAFSTTSELTNHMRTHDNIRPYPCRYACGKSFRHCSNRSTHERIHMDGNLRPFQCEYCDKTFVTKGDCRAHQAVHTMSRNFSCDICELSFKLHKHYMQHLTTKSHKKIEEHLKTVKKKDSVV